jgi:hypothetical protein
VASIEPIRGPSPRAEGEGSRFRPPLVTTEPFGGVAAAARRQGRVKSTGETLLAPPRNRRTKVGRTTNPGRRPKARGSRKGP